MLFSLNRKVETQKVHTNSKTISVTIINQLVLIEFAGNKNVNGEKLLLCIEFFSKAIFFINSVVKTIIFGDSADIILFLINVDAAYPIHPNRPQ